MPRRLLALFWFALATASGFAQAALLSPAVRTVVDSARAQTHLTTSYDPSYVRIGYPDGDVKPETGVCADVVIRAFRKAGVDLQKDVHEDMARKFKAYPQRWGLKRPDTNIDHRRVPNLMTFFRRAGKELPITAQAGDYLPGDVVAWDLGGGITHIGVVSDENDRRSGRHWMVHNIGRGARLEDVLFSWKVIGHYRYFR
ncbi:MAG: DUF1287 domain-containing protein [Acidobacteriota bacterium]